MGEGTRETFSGRTYGWELFITAAERVRRGKIRDDSTAHPRNLDGFGCPELLLVTEDVVEISYSSFQFQVIKFVSIPFLSRERKDLNLDFRNFRLWRIERSKISFRHANNQGEEGIVNCIFVERR